MIKTKPRVCLVVPPDSIYVPAPGLEFYKESPLMSLTMMATLVLKKGYHAEIIDLRKGEPDRENITRYIANNFDICGITTWIHSYPFLEEVTSKIKKQNPKCLIVVGGPFFSSIPKLLMEHLPIDVGVIGEGEVTFIELLNHLYSNDGDLQNICGIAYNNRGKLNFTSVNLSQANLNNFPNPKLDLWPDGFGRKKGTIFYETSRGCPYRCSFCSDTIKKYFAKSPQKLASELEYIKLNYDISHFFFVDPCFNFTVDRVKVLCKVFEGLGITWECMLRIAKADYDMFSLMHKAGCRKVWLGVESLSEESLEKSGKGIKKDIIEGKVKQALEAGLRVICWFILGLPGETEATLDEMVNFTEKYQIIPRPNYLIPLPGTPYWDIAVKDFFSGEEIKCLKWVAEFGNGKKLMNFTSIPDRKLINVFDYFYGIMLQRGA